MDAQVSARTHIFNSEFFSKIAAAPNSKSAYQEVHRWARLFDLFALDKLVMTIYQDSHWSVVAVLNPAAIMVSRCSIDIYLS